MHTLKSDERMDWSAVDIWMRDVELDDFITSNSRDVFYSDRNMNWRRTGDLRIDRNRWSRNRLTAWRKVAGSEVGSKEFRIREGGEGEAVAEGEEGRCGGVAVGAVGHGVAGEGRELRERFVEGDGEASRGIVIAGEDVGDGGAAFFAGIPGGENGGGVLVCPGDGDGRAAG